MCSVVSKNRFIQVAFIDFIFSFLFGVSQIENLYRSTGYETPAWTAGIARRNYNLVIILL
jgi:uncharacterized membrane protein YeiB